MFYNRCNVHAIGKMAEHLVHYRAASELESFPTTGMRFEIYIILAIFAHVLSRPAVCEIFEEDI